jgi:hypothetical protein
MNIFLLILYFFTAYYLINTGFLFFLPLMIKTKKDYDVIKSYLYKKALQFLLGIAGIIVGILRLIFPHDAPIILGDLIPAILSIVVGLTFLLGHIRFTIGLSQQQMQEGKEILASLQIPIGIIAFTAGILHVFLCGLPLL